MSVPWTPEYTATVLRGLTAAQLDGVTFQTFQRHPCVQVLRSETGRRLIAQERARRAQADRYLPANSNRDATAAVVGPSGPPRPAAVKPVQIGLFE